MKRFRISVAIAIAALIASAPVAIVITLLLMPLWSWIEETLHVESVGHSGPAEWCFAVTFVAVAAVLVGLGIHSVRHSGG